MRVAVIGLGSMGKRRIGLVRELFPDCTIVGVDARADRRDEAESLFDIDCVASVEKLNDIDCALVCTSPLSHAAIIRECLLRSWDVFTELNLVSDAYEDNMALAEKNGCVLFLSSTFVYRKETQFIVDAVKNRHGVYRYHVGQYLPDWHPWENFKDFFVADVRTNGVREILAIEIPWLVRAFGNVTSTSVKKQKISSLDIPYDDTVSLAVEHESGVIGNLVVDVVSRKPVRLFEYFNEEDYLVWGGTPESLERFNVSKGEMEPVDLYAETVVEHKKGYAAFVVENAYRNELECFFKCVEGNAKPLYSFNDDLRTLSLINEIEGA